MEKLKMQSRDVVGGNVEKIAALFPQCVTERLNKDGKPELAIDFDKLRAELSNVVLEDDEERYQFTWPDKRAPVWQTSESISLCALAGKNLLTSIQLKISTSRATTSMSSRSFVKPILVGSR